MMMVFKHQTIKIRRRRGGEEERSLFNAAVLLSLDDSRETTLSHQARGFPW